MMKSIINDDDLLFSDGYQVMYFYTTNMPFHKRMNTIISNIEKKYNNVEFYSIDVYLVKSFVKRFDLIDVPTICLFYNGKEKTRIRGIVMSSAIKSEFYKHINS